MIKAVLFDFDGTIINTNELIKVGLNNFSQHLLSRNLTEIELKKLNGKHLNEQLNYLNPTDLDETILDFKKWYGDHHHYYANEFPGIVTLLELLKCNGIISAIVTNNSRGPLHMGLDQLGIDDLFDYIVTSDDVSQPKPSPEGIEKTLAHLKLKKSEVLFVGDSKSDILAAQNAGVESCLVSWSILNTNERKNLNPTYLLETPYDLLDIVINASKLIA